MPIRQYLVEKNILKCALYCVCKLDNHYILYYIYYPPYIFLVVFILEGRGNLEPKFH